MRILSVLFLFCLSFSSVLAQCNLEYKKDQFNGLESWSTKYEVVSRTMRGTLKLGLRKYVEESDTTLWLSVYVEPMSMVCLNDDSKVLLKSGDNIMTINLSGNVDCASQGSLLISSGIIEPEVIRSLKQLNIDAIRVYFTEGYIDFAIKNKQDYFIRNMPCFKN